MAEPHTHIAALVQRYSNGRSIKEIERAAGLNEGALGYYLKPSSTGRKQRVPRLDVMERFEQALGAPLDEVSQAFVRDAQFDTGESFSAAEIDLIHRLRELPDCDQKRMLAILDTFEQHPYRTSA